MSRQFRSDDTSKWLDRFGTGSDGNGSINTSTDAPIDSACSGTSATTSLSATNASFATNQLILIHQTRGTGAGNWELNKIASYTAGTITTAYALQNTYTNSGASLAQVLVMTEYNDLTINSGQTFTGKAWNGTVGGIVAKFVKGTCTIAGSIAVNTKGFRGGASAVNNSSGTYQGEGTNGAGAASTLAANGNGGGTTNSAGPSGGGGNGTAGGNGSGGSGAGNGGSAVGATALTTMLFGGASGGSCASATAVNGSNGAGIVLIIGKRITVTGSINLNGTNGGTTAFANAGGSAGGSCLLKGESITLGSNLITAVGSTGGSQNGWTGGTGGVGRIHIDYGTTYTGTTNPTLDATKDSQLASAGSVAFIFDLI